VAALRLIGVLIVALSIPATGSTQTAPSTPWFVRTGATSGYILPANPFMASADHPGGAIHWGQNLTFEIGRQTDGNQDWHQLYGVPSYGFGFSVASFSNDVAHARPVEAYTFFSWPFARLGDRLDLTTDFGMVRRGSAGSNVSMAFAVKRWPPISARSWSPISMRSSPTAVA